MAISLVASSGWYQASSYGTNVPVPSGAQPGDLLIGVVISAQAAPPNGSPYPFSGSSGYSEAVGGAEVWVVYRWSTGNDPALSLPATSLDEWGNPANTAAGQLFVFRGPIESLGVSGGSASYASGPSITIGYPTRSGEDTYSLVAITGREMGSMSVTSNPKGLSFLSEAAFTYPFNLRGFVFGGNISGDSGSGSSISLSITGSSDWWEGGGCAYSSFSPRSASLGAIQSSHYLSAYVQAAYPERYVSLGSSFFGYPQSSNTLSASATAGYPVRSLALSVLQQAHSISASLYAFFSNLNANAVLIQAGNTLSSVLGIYKPLSAALTQSPNTLNANTAVVVGLALNELQQSHTFSSAVVAIIGLSMSASQANNVLFSIVNGRGVFLNAVQDGNVVNAGGTVDVTASVGASQQADSLLGRMRHFWLSQSKDPATWNKKSSSLDWEERVVPRV
jgi:hypothetical protein